MVQYILYIYNRIPDLRYQSGILYFSVKNQCLSVLFLKVSDKEHCWFMNQLPTNSWSTKTYNINFIYYSEVTRIIS